MTDRKKPGVAFWATVALVSLPVLYVLGFGPACWWMSRVVLAQGSEAHKSTVRAVPRFYRPLLNEYTPKPIIDALRRYGSIGINDDRETVWLFILDYEG